MAQLAYLAIANALLAALLGLLVWWISRWIRRPAIVHTLWILVLVRLVTPPLLVFHVTGLGAWLSDTIPTQTAEVALTMVRDATFQQTQMLAMMRRVLDHEDLLPRMDLAPQGQSESREAHHTAYVPITRTVNFSVAALLWIQVGCVLAVRHGGQFLEHWVPIWLAGTAACCLIQLYLGLRFRARLRREAYASRIWQARAERIARRMGLRSCPAVLLVRATISPMLWGFGNRTRLLFPERLLETLNSSSQDTLLAHELAHYRRGDQWVRLLELFVTALFWWHPVVWWARYHIEAAEEECCDAWAVTQANGCPRTYAEALLTTVDFVSLGLPMLPPAASGVGSRLLRRRLTAIMRGASHPPSLTPGTCAGVWILAVFVLVPCPAIWQAFGGTTPVLSDNVVALVLPGPQRFVEPTKPLAPDKSTASTVISHPLVARSSLIAQSANGQFQLTLESDQRACLREFSILGERSPGMEPRHEHDLGVGRVSCVDFSPNNQLLAIGGLDGAVELIDCHTGQTRRRWSAGDTAVVSVAFSPDGQHLAIGNRAGTCKVFQISPFRSETIQRERGKTISCVRYSVDGSCLAVVVSGHPRDTQIDVWDLVSGRSCGSLRPDKAVAAVLATKTATEWIIVERNGSARVWSTGGQLTSANSIVSPALIRRLGFTPTRAETLERWLAADQPDPASLRQP